MNEVDESKYKYRVYLELKVERIDGKVLNKKEDKMALKMHSEASKAIALVMAKHGSTKSTEISKDCRKY